MSITHTLVRNWTNGAKTLTSTKEATGSSAKEIDEAIGATPDTEITGQVDVSALKMLYIVCDQDILLETNSGSAPVDSFSLKANQPLIWESSDGYFTNPLGTDVTSWFVTNTSGETANIKINTLEDATP